MRDLDTRMLVRRRGTIVAVLLSITIGTIYYLTAPLDSIIRWPDSPRHALNGALVYDAMRALPWQDPMGWALAYYDQYPALTFGFYPPLPAIMLVPFYAVFGVSTASSMMLMAVCMTFLSYGLYLVGRRLLPEPASIASVVLLAGRDWLLLALSLLVGFAALTGISLKETRHATPLLIPLALFAAATMHAAAQLLRARVGQVSVAAVFGAIALFGYQLSTVMVETVVGPRQAADWITSQMPEGGAMAVSTRHDGPFIFRVRERDADRRYFASRIDKLLLNITIMPELGLNPQDKSEAEIEKILNCGRFRYIALEPRDFMTVSVMLRFRRACWNARPFGWSRPFPRRPKGQEAS